MPVFISHSSFILRNIAESTKAVAGGALEFCRAPCIATSKTVGSFNDMNTFVVSTPPPKYKNQNFKPIFGAVFKGLAINTTKILR